MDLLKMISEYRARIHPDISNADAPAKELEETIQRLIGGFSGLFSSLQDSDWPPTSTMVNAVVDLVKQWEAMLKRKKELK